MQVAVLGAGRVGLVAAGGLARAGHSVACAERDPQRYECLRGGGLPFHEPELAGLLAEELAARRLTYVTELRAAPAADVVMIAVGTPLGRDGRADLGQVHAALEEILAWANRPLVLVMKSTVPPGTGRQIRERFLSRSRVSIAYVANPEFLREGDAVHDWFHPHRTVLGADDPSGVRAVRTLYAGLPGPVFETDVTTAEMVKYASNAFLATKVSFINEIANLCDAVGADVEMVADAMGADPRIGPHYLRPGIGYGGSCFPKDTRALDALADGVGYRFRLLKAVIEVNAHQWRLAVKRVAEALGTSTTGAGVAVLGLAFKPGTDDLRESPAIDIIGVLRGRHMRVSAWDPMAGPAARAMLPSDVVIPDDPYEACEGARAIFVLTAWPEITALDWGRIRSRMAPPYVVFDGRNCLPDTLGSAGLVHLRVGRATHRTPELTVP